MKVQGPEIPTARATSRGPAPDQEAPRPRSTARRVTRHEQHRQATREGKPARRYPWRHAPGRARGPSATDARAEPGSLAACPPCAHAAAHRVELEPAWRGRGRGGASAVGRARPLPEVRERRGGGHARSDAPASLALGWGRSVRVLVVTSCTGRKAVSSPRGLTLSDFLRGRAHIQGLEGTFPALCPAEDMYAGSHHVRLMRGVAEFRRARGPGSLDLYILSAGYGLLRGSQKLAPYDVSFTQMSNELLRQWSSRLGVPAAFRAAVAEPYDLALILLGKSYLEACSLDSLVVYGGPTIFFGTAPPRPRPRKLRVVSLKGRLAKRFACGVEAVRGELGSRVLSRLATNDQFADLLMTARDVLACLDPGARQ